jgi:hypothetical protein
MADLGITSLLTRPEPLVLEAAESLGGASLRVEGRTRVGGVDLPFSAELPIQQEEETEIGIPVLRSSPGAVAPYEVLPGEPGLSVRFDPRPWLADVDFDGLVADEACAPGGPEVACQGSIEQSCDEDGNVASTRDCADADQFCASGQGCVEMLVFPEGGQALRAIRTAVLAGPRPVFEWGFSP